MSCSASRLTFPLLEIKRKLSPLIPVEVKPNAVKAKKKKAAQNERNMFNIGLFLQVLLIL